MKKLLSLFLLMSQAGFAQNYQPFPNPQDTLVFADHQDSLRFIIIDSVQSNGIKTTYYPSREWKAYLDSINFYGCMFQANGPGWVGHKVLDSAHIIRFNHRNMRLTVNKQLALRQDDSAGFVRRYGHNYDLILRLDSTANTGGDSTRHYSLRIIDSIGATVFQNLPVVLSKNFGLQAWPDVLDANYYDRWGPGWYTPTAYHRISQFAILETGDIFDWQPGDVFHYRIYSSSQGSSASILEERSILNRSLSGNGDSVIYSISVKRQSSGIGFGSSFSNTTLDTLQESYPLHSKYPLSFTGNPYWPGPFFSFSSGANEIILARDAFQGRAGLSLYSVGLYNFGNSDSCFQHGFSRDYWRLIVATGIGVVKERENIGTSPSQSNIKRLVYYKKGNETWGSPLNIGLSDQKLQAQLHPNPAGDYLRLESPKPLEVQVYQLNGRLVKTARLENGSLNVSDLAPGLYLLQSEQGTLKFVKQ